MTIIQMKHFYYVCINGSVSKTAKQFFVTQPTITSSIKSLEAEIEVTLFLRKNNQLILTEEGKLLLEKVEHILNELDDLSKDIKAISEKKKIIKLGIPLSVGPFLLPGLLKEFNQLHPDIVLQFFEGGGLETLQMMIDGGLDMAVASINKEFSDKILWKKLFDSEVCYFVSKDHPWANKESISIEEAVSQPLVLIEDKKQSYRINQRLHSQFEAKGLKPKILLMTNQIHTIENVVLNQLAGAFFQREGFVNHEMIPIPLKEPLYSPIGIAYVKGKALHKCDKILIDFINQTLKK